LIFYHNPFSIIIPFYGFLILILKYQKLLDVKEANSIQKILGSIVAVSSFFVYYGVVLVFSGVFFYSVANYTVYLLGLFLIFFKFSALKEAFTPLFLIVAATSSTFIAAWLKPFLSPFTNDFAYIIMNILRALGVDANVFYVNNMAILSILSLPGKVVQTAFVYECIGVYSALVFSIILIVVLFEDPSSLKVKLAYTIVGLLGTFALNIFRVTTIFLAHYFYGAGVGATVHMYIGYALFSAWLAIFFCIYSKRQTLHTKITSFWKRIH
jgi:exosortase/archaeosortase family protein